MSKDLFCFVCLLFRHFFVDKRLQPLATTGCSARGLLGPLGGDLQPSPLHSLLKGSESVKRGYGFRSKGGTKAVKRGYRINLVDFVGYTPPNVS